MTKQRNDSHGTEFGKWLRQQPELDSLKKGYVATNVDYIWKNYKTGHWIFIEEKRYKSAIKGWQRDLFIKLHRVAQKSKLYRGFFLIVFEKTNPEDGKIWINHKERTKEDLLDLLQFKGVCYE